MIFIAEMRPRLPIWSRTLYNDVILEQSCTSGTPEELVTMHCRCLGPTLGDVWRGIDRMFLQNSPLVILMCTLVKMHCVRLCSLVHSFIHLFIPGVFLECLLCIQVGTLLSTEALAIKGTVSSH